MYVYIYVCLYVCMYVVCIYVKAQMNNGFGLKYLFSWPVNYFKPSHFAICNYYTYSLM